MGHTLRKLLAAIMVACFSITFIAGCGDTPEEKAQKQAEQQAKAQKKAQEEAEKQAKIEAEKAAKEAEKKAQEEAAAREAAKTPEERAAEDGVPDTYRWFYGTDRFNAYLAVDEKHTREMPGSESWGHADVHGYDDIRIFIREVDKSTKDSTFSVIHFMPKFSAKKDDDYHLPNFWVYSRNTFDKDPVESPDNRKRVKSIALQEQDPKNFNVLVNEKGRVLNDAEEMIALIQWIFPQK